MDEAAVRPSSLGRYTSARVGLGRSGSAIGTTAQLEFQLDHALARDAVRDEADLPGLLAGLRERGMDALLLESAVPPGPGARATYLRRPDLGRMLAEESAAALKPLAKPSAGIVFMVADGLSALAVDRHALPLLEALTGVLPKADWSQSPVCLVRNGRVAVGDAIGGLLSAKLSILLIGERPGLSAPDSLGVYLTSDPRPGRTDAERNCISNIRAGGLGYAEAAARIAFYCKAASELGGTGYALKDASGVPVGPALGAGQSSLR